MARDFAAEYHAACIEDRTPGATLRERVLAEAKMDRIYLAAIAADVDLPIYAIDEQARLELYPA